MADMKISDLPAAASVADAQQFEVNDAGNSRRVTFQMLREKIKSLADDWYAAKSHNHSGTYANASHQHTIAQITDASAVGKSVLAAANQAAARAALGAGTGNSNLAIGTTATTAKAGNWKPHIDADTTGQLPWARLTGIPDGAAGLPQALGVGSYVMGYKSGSNPAIPAGTTLPGSQLTAAAGRTGAVASGWDGGWGVVYTLVTTPGLVGTWRAMMTGGPPLVSAGQIVAPIPTLFLRIA